MLKELFSGLAILLTFVLFFPYIRGIHRRTIKPHVFSWVAWGLGTLIVFFAQLADGAGVGAWPIGISGAVTCYIAVIAYVTRADTKITRSDWAFFCAALLALPFWFLTSDPLWAVVVLTVADTIAFGPTLRKAYDRPHEEGLGFFALAALRNLLVVLALERYSLTTTLFPAAVGMACLLVALVLSVRRRQILGEAGRD